jgi:hypothetical protein
MDEEHHMIHKEDDCMDIHMCTKEDTYKKKIL